MNLHDSKRLTIIGLFASASLFGQTVTYLVNVPGDINLPNGTFSSNAGDLRGCLYEMNLNGTTDNYNITFDSSIGTIQLGGILPPVGLNGRPENITIDGSGGAEGMITIDGLEMYPGFFAYLPAPITFQNLTIANTVATGGSGSGGALGAGAGIFVGQFAQVNLVDVTIANCHANGGNGSFGKVGNAGAGGGGLFGGGGGIAYKIMSNNYYNYGGGGGFGSDGGAGNYYGCGGGGGLSPYGNGGGMTESGNGGAGNYNGYLGGGIPGYSGGTDSSGRYPGGNYCGGGGGGANYAAGAGGGGLNGQNGTADNGGDGGSFGGGGSGYIDGGDGGYYGGGGAGYSGGGATGLGGGGGGGRYGMAYTETSGGNGAFGGGGGGSLNGGAGGVGGGNGSSSGGGGGAGFGGGIFVMYGGTLIIYDGVTINNCGTSPGSGGSMGSGNGAAIGNGIFYNTNGENIYLTIEPATDSNVTFSSDIADDNILNIPADQSYGEGTVGTLSLAIAGEGDTILSASTNAYHTGTTTVTGNFVLNGTVYYSPVTLVGGTLSGTGTLLTTLESTEGGTIAPGNSIGTLNVGDTIIDGSSTYDVEINDTGAASLLAVTGTATIDTGAALFVTLDAGTYTGPIVYTIMTATEGITGGELFTISSTDPSQSFSLSLDDPMHTLYLTLLSSGPVYLPTSWLSGNALHIANYLNSIISYAPLGPVFDALTDLSGEAYESAFNQISPARCAFNRYAIDNTTFFLSDQITSRFNDLRFTRQIVTAAKEVDPSVAELIAGPVMASEKAQKGRTFWLAPFGYFAHQNPQDQSPAFNYTSVGLLAGLDGFVTDRFRLGAALAYVSIGLHDEQSMGSEQIQEGLGTIFGGYIGPNGFFEIALWGGYNHTKETRKINFPGISETVRGKIHGWLIDPHVEFGYTFHPKKTLSWEPYAALDWAVNFQRPYSETGGTLKTHQKGANVSMLRSEVGLASAQIHFFDDGAQLGAQESAAYVNKAPFGIGQTQASIVGAPGGFFTVETLNANQNLFSPTVEIFYKTAGIFLISASYEGEFGSGYTANSVIGKFEWNF